MYRCLGQRDKGSRFSNKKLHQYGLQAQQIISLIPKDDKFSDRTDFLAGDEAKKDKSPKENCSGMIKLIAFFLIKSFY